MTRLEVVNQILGLLRRSDCTTALGLMFLTQGTRRIERQLRVPSMERVHHVVAASNMHSVTVPTDLLQIIDVVADGRPLDKMAHRVLISHAHRNPALGCPTAYSRFGSGLYLWPTLQAGKDVCVSYYGTLTDLPSDTSVNEATTEFPDLLTYAALAFAGDYFRHDEADRWEEKFQGLLTETQDLATQLDATGGSEAVQSAYGDC